jgi:hypothetical protein
MTKQKQKPPILATTTTTTTTTALSRASLSFDANPDLEREFFAAVRKHGAGKWKTMAGDARYSWHRLHRRLQQHQRTTTTTKRGAVKGGGKGKMTKTSGAMRRERSDVETALESHWHRLLVKENEDGDKKIKEEVVKKNNLFRAPRCRQSSTTKGKRREKDTQQQQQQQHRLKPYTKTLTRTMDQFILECLNVDSKEDAANEKDGKTIDQVASYCIEKFREEEEDGAIGKYRFGGLFEVCKGAREQRVPQRLAELGKEGKVRRDRVTVPGDKSGKLHVKYVALVDVNGKAIQNTNRNKRARDDTEDESENEEDESILGESSEEEEEEDEDDDSQEDSDNKKQSTNSNKNGDASTKKRRPKCRAKVRGKSKQMSKAAQRTKIEEELEKLPPVFYYDGRYLSAEQAANEAREAFEEAELAANEAELAEKEAADAEAEARQAAALVESLCGEAERLKNTRDDGDKNIPAVANEPKRLIQA